MLCIGRQDYYVKRERFRAVGKRASNNYNKWPFIHRRLGGAGYYNNKCGHGYFLFAYSADQTW